MVRPVIMDCDPGNDDAVALLVAMASPEDFNILGITTVFGNVSLEQITKNARRICELAGKPEIPVYAGCPRPMIREIPPADYAHGVTGLDGCSLPDPKIPLQPQHAVEFLITTLKTYSQKVTLLPTAPLTNIALALIQAPEIKENIEEIVLMGGSSTAGNITPAAEFNMHGDPYAAYVVLNSGLKITMAGLNVTHQLTVGPKRLKQLRALGSLVGTEIANMLECGLKFDETAFDLPGRAIHDACVPIYLIKPELFKGQEGYVQVEIHSPENLGATIVSFYPKHVKMHKNVFVLNEVDDEDVFDLILERLARYSSGQLQASSKT